MKKSRSSKSKNKMYLILGIISIVIIGVVVTYTSNSQENTNDSKSKLLGSWMDIHGVGMFLSGTDDTLYLATHNGLFKKGLDGWKLVGNDNSDLMGFSISSKEGVLYSSGHPKSGGNLGFRISTDNGNSWTMVSKVKDNPVDFHAMTASKAQNGLVYGSPGGGSELFVTLDEGVSWKLLTPPDRIVSLAADPLNPDKVFAGTVSGLYLSNNKGQQWQKINSNVESGTITGIGFASDGKTMYLFSSLNGNGAIYKSITDGEIMVKTQGQITNTGAIFNFAPGRNGEIYATAMERVSSGTASSVYMTNDDGATWILEGTNNSELALTKNT
ncbi:MAG: WD40/YVTN/BNR-like repeat-containing protein [Nitrosarchaeum sp.]